MRELARQERGGARGKTKDRAKDRAKEQKGNEETIGGGQKLARKLFRIKEDDIVEARRIANEKREESDRKAKLEAKVKIRKTFRK